MRATRSIGLLLGASALLVMSVALFERRVVARLTERPDPDADRDFRFPTTATRQLPTPDGGHLHVEECGSGAPIVLLHGHGASLGSFALLADGLAHGGHRVIAFDLRGFGRSSPVPPEFDYDGLVGDVAFLLESLDLHEVVIVGHSMGGAVALGLAIQKPEVVARRVSSLVLVSSTARGPADRWRNRVQVSALERPELEKLSRHPLHGVVLARANFGTEPRRSHVEAARAAGFDSSVEKRQGFTRRLLGVDLSNELVRVELPVLVLAGSADRVLSAQESVRLAKLLPNARLELFQGAGHMLPMERSDEVAELILEFADEITPV